MMAFIYILYSKTLKKYYTGSCLDLKVRMKEHLDKKYKDGFTAKTDDWELFFSISDLDYLQARKIELHIKKMKSKVYIENLKKYTDLSQKLVDRYKL